jgi:hypothetical protein
MTGQYPPEHYTVTTEYHRGRFVRQVETVQNGNDVNITEVRCTCPIKGAACSLHGKMPS